MLSAEVRDGGGGAALLEAARATQSQQLDQLTTRLVEMEGNVQQMAQSAVAAVREVRIVCTQCKVRRAWCLVHHV